MKWLGNTTGRNLSSSLGLRLSNRVIVIISLIILVALCVAAIYSFGNTGTVFSSHAAVVNGEAITLTALDDRYILLKSTDSTFFESELSETEEFETKQLILDELIEQTLILQEAQRRNLEIDEASIDELIEIQVKAAQESNDPNSGKLIALYCGESNRSRMRSRLIERALLQGLVLESELTEEEMQAYYERHKVDGQTGMGLLLGTYPEERSRIIAYLLDEKRAIQWTAFMGKLKADADIEFSKAFQKPADSDQDTLDD